MSLRLLHTADVHLDKPFAWLGDRGREQRSQLKETFRSVIDLALRERVDAMLVAGDLFDNNWPTQSTLDFVQTQLRRLSIPVFLLPGTHDCLDGGSIYRKVDLSRTVGPHVHVFDGEHTAFEEAGLDLTVHGRANCTKTSSKSPLAGLKTSPSTRHNVAMAHGSSPMPGTDNDFPISQSDLDGARMDYVALGHWHTYRDCTAANHKACYCGPPELLAEDKVGSALLVDIGEGGVTVDQRSISRRRYRQMDVAVDGIESAEELKERLRAQSDADLVLKVVLTGLRPLSLVLEPIEIRQDLGEAFFDVEIDDRTHVAMSPEALLAIPENTVSGQFVRRMVALIKETQDPHDLRVRETALQIGVLALQGKKVL